MEPYAVNDSIGWGVWRFTAINDTVETGLSSRDTRLEFYDCQAYSSSNGD